MAYYTDAVSGFDDLRTALVAACVAEGWSWDGAILSKGAAYVRPYVSTTENTTEGPGLIIEGGTGVSSGSLTGASTARPRLGRPGAAPQFAPLTWPARYYILIHENPDEVFLILNFSIDYFYWLAFGVSDQPGIDGTGLWLAASTRRGYATDSSESVNGVIISPTSGGGATISTRYLGSLSFFWDTNDLGGGAAGSPRTIHTGLDSVSWAGGPGDVQAGSVNAIYAAIPHVGRSPSAWNNESVLIPIKIHQWRASSKCSLVCQVRHARYCRVDNYEPGQVITLGDEQWKIFPFYRKNTTSARDGGNRLDHTGTFGWAIRYDGP